ncbi:hypothetical protein M422DRAFT_240359 [Sphaerobolus stellatus SS14]|nr:hypothetical protein M422DRAFT_240359 [Sphaerobolus stellatus SS14]
MAREKRRVRDVAEIALRQIAENLHRVRSLQMGPSSYMATLFPEASNVTLPNMQELTILSPRNIRPIRLGNVITPGLSMFTRLSITHGLQFVPLSQHLLRYDNCFDIHSFQDLRQLLLHFPDLEEAVLMSESSPNRAGPANLNEMKKFLINQQGQKRKTFLKVVRDMLTRAKPALRSLIIRQTILSKTSAVFPSLLGAVPFLEYLEFITCAVDHGALETLSAARNPCLCLNLKKLGFVESSISEGFSGLKTLLETRLAPEEDRVVMQTLDLTEVSILELAPKQVRDMQSLAVKYPDLE